MVVPPVVQEKRCIATVHRTASRRCRAVANGHSETLRATPGRNAGHGRDDTPEPGRNRIERGDTCPVFSISENYFDAWATSAFEAQHPIVCYVPRTVASPADVVEKKYLAGWEAG
jgi:hypothetical protein